jgi:serine/threonine-protein kinase
VAEAKAAVERRARGLTASLAAALVGLLLLGGASGLYLQRQRHRRATEMAQRLVAAETALERAEELRQRGRWVETRPLLKQALEHLGPDAPESMRVQLEGALSDADLVIDLEAVRLKRATWVEGAFDDAGADREYAEVFQRHGLGAEGDDSQAVASRVRGSSVREQLLGALDDWAFVTRVEKRGAWLMQVARRADPHPWRDQLRNPKLWKDPRRLETLVAEARMAALTPQLAVALGRRLQADRAAALLRQVQQRHPDDFWVNLMLGTRLNQAKQEEAIGYLRAAVALRPLAVVALNNLGTALRDKGKVEEAIACFHKAIALDPKFAPAHYNLGSVLAAKGKMEEAIACFRQTLALDPKFALAHNNLGRALHDKGKENEAIARFRTAIVLDPKLASAHNSLGIALAAKGKVEEALACFRQTLALDPKFAPAHNNLGTVLVSLGQLEQAVACFRESLAINPRDVKALCNLGEALDRQGNADDALACFRKALQLDPRCAPAHINVGTVLASKGELKAAIACFRKALELDGRLVEPAFNLAQALRNQGNVTEAIAWYRKVLELLPAQHSWRAVVSRQVKECQQLANLEEKLAPILRGDAAPAAADQCLEVASLCQRKQWHATAARFAVAAFSAEPKWAEDLEQQHRYNAARSAARAAAGQAEDARLLPDKVVLKLRQRAWHWLRADLVLWTRLVERGEVGPSRLGRTLDLWRKDPALASVRDPAALARLDADERQQWRRLWQDVDALRQRVSRKK